MLTAPAAGQVGLAQALALAIGTNVGTGISTAFVGALGGYRNGQCLAAALFNRVTALPVLALLLPLHWLVIWMTGSLQLGGGDRQMLRAMRHAPSRE